MPVARRAFAVFWWGLTLAPIACTLATYANHLGPNHLAIEDVIFVAVVTPLPFIATVLIRWIATGRWRFGPRW